MVDVWVLPSFNAQADKPVVAAWYCPALAKYALTKRARASDGCLGLRLGCGLAVLSAVKVLGAPLRFHIPNHPTPRWVSDPTRPSRFPNLWHRLLYAYKVAPMLRMGQIQFIREGESMYKNTLEALIYRGEAPF